jgi:hypothetical protein
MDKHSLKVMGTMSHVEFWLDDNNPNKSIATQKLNLNCAQQAQALIQLVEQKNPYKVK